MKTSGDEIFYLYNYLIYTMKHWPLRRFNVNLLLPGLNIVEKVFFCTSQIHQSCILKDNIISIGVRVASSESAIFPNIYQSAYDLSLITYLLNNFNDPTFQILSTVKTLIV